jgi:3-isopropylmalate/(R)-2-methylmalate dehydratase large subunit
VSPGQSLAQKILASHVGRERVEIGEVIFPEFDFIICQEVPFPEFWAEVESMGVTKLAKPDKTIIVSDHEVPILSLQGRARWAKTVELVNRLGIKYFFRPGRSGIQHFLLPEKGFILPGRLTCSFDGHALNFGALGCYPMTAVYEFPTVMATGTIWVMVPETILVNLEGRMPAGCGIRDLALLVSEKIGPQLADSKVIQFSGEGVSHLTVHERMILCGVMAEIGAEAAIIEPDAVTLDYVSKIAIGNYKPVYGDRDVKFAAEFDFQLGSVEPMVAMPPSPDNISPIQKVVGTPIDSAYIGSCQSGTIDELRAAAEILKGRTVHPDVTLLIVPSTQQIYKEAAQEGFLGVFADAGAVILDATCLPCLGHVFQMAKGEVRICTSTRNDRGRMGSLESDIYLAGAATVAASAVSGRISDPREFMN